MNYLAHAWLSFNKPEILAGNMISDYVKGKKRFDFDEGIQKGIMLHRNIDAFTDSHEITKKAKTFFKEAVGLYAGAFVDVVYDHFLAADTNEFSDDALLKFSLDTYATLENYKSIFPQRFERMLVYMKRDNWLYNYKTLNGVEKSFTGLMYRAKYLENSSQPFIAFVENYDALKNCYEVFAPVIKEFACHQLQNNQ